MMLPMAFAAVLAATGAQPAAQPDTGRGFAVEYADGRRTVTPISLPDASSWTTTFPRVSGADTSHNGQPLFAMQYEWSVEAKGMAVTVALLYGPSHERVPVETVHVTLDRPARAAGLDAYGIRPVVFSLVPLPPPPPALRPPAVVNPSSNLEIKVDTAADPVPAYVATLVNRSPRSVVMFRYMAFRGPRPMLSGRRRGPQNTDLILPGESLQLTFAASLDQGRGDAPPSGWTLMDRIEITSVLWSDGSVDGDASIAADERALDAGTALQLDRIVRILRAAAASPAANPPAQLRAAFESLTVTVTDEQARAAADAIPGPARLPIAQVTSTMTNGMRNTRKRALDDVDEVTQGQASVPASRYVSWLMQVADGYAAWRGRIKP